jgi:hypothetical protein
MGMFERPENFGENFSVGDVFILMDARYDGDITTSFGPAKKSTFTIMRRGDESGHQYTALGDGFAEQSRSVAPGDLPCVVEYTKVPLQGDKEVKRLEKLEISPEDWFKGQEPNKEIPF